MSNYVHQHGKGLGAEPKANYDVWRFDSLDALLQQAKATPAEYIGTSDASKSQWKDFFITRNLEQAIELGWNGWRDAADKVQGYMQPIREQLGNVLSQVAERVIDMTGYEPDIDRFLSGELDCMVDDWIIEQPKQGKVFTLLVNSTMTANNSATDILKRGAALCALIEAFTMLGYQLEVWTELTVTNIPYGKDDFGVILTRISTAGDPIDVNRVMFACGHGDYNRRVMWAVGEGFDVMRDKYKFRAGGSYGMCKNGIHMADQVGASITVELDSNHSMTRSPVKWILDQLEAQGVYDPLD